MLHKYRGPGRVSAVGGHGLSHEELQLSSCKKTGHCADEGLKGPWVLVLACH